MSSYNDWARLMQSRPLPYFMQSEAPETIDAAPLPYQTQNEAQPYEAAAKAATSVMDVMMEEASGVAEQKRRLQMALVKMQQLKDSGTISQGNELDFNPVAKGTLEGLSEVTGVAPSGRVMDRLTKLQSPVLRPQEGETRSYPGIPFLPAPLDPTVGMQIPAWLDEATTLAGDIGNTGLAAVDMAAAAPLALKGARALGESGQIPIRAAKKIDMKIKLPDDETFKMAVKNTDGAEITPDGLKLNLTRFQPPEAGGMPSLRSGVFYLPEGSPNKKYYSTGKQGYGGSEKITGETLVKNPLFVKGATGGKAPEHAYDLIEGSGTYEKMRKEALDVNWGRSAQGKSGGPDIEDFLDKYAPDLSGQGQYILENSKKGNTLAYALQEAAVAHSVRKNGYDAVIGYGVGRKVKEPFISEVFDVREIDYPTKFGDYSIHPSFKLKSESGGVVEELTKKPYADMTQAEIKALTPDHQADRMLSTFPEDEIRNDYLQADDATKQTMREQVMKGREAVTESTATQKPASIFDEFGDNPTRPWDETFRYVAPEQFENYRGRDTTPGLHERLLRLDSELRAQEIRDSELLESVSPKNRAAVEDLIINKRNHIAMEIEKWGGEPAGESMDLAQQVRQIANKYDVKIAGAAKRGEKIKYKSGFRTTFKE